MHDKSYQLMVDMLKSARGSALSVLDVGSLDINGTYKPLVIERGWTYTGLDMQAGANVDVVASKPNKYPFDAGAFDVVISGNIAHNIERPWKWLPELVRVLRPGGLLCIVSVWRLGVNHYPVDTWRWLPNAYSVLFDDTGKLTNYSIGMNDEGDSWGSAFKE